MTDRPDEEVPGWAHEVSEVVRHELDATRALIGRLLAVTDALLAASLTVTGIFVGGAAAADNPWVAVIGAPVVLGLAYLEAQNWVEFRRMTVRSRELEGLYRTYVSMLQESRAGRRGAVRTFRAAVRRYKYGIERQLRTPEFDDLRNVNRDRLTPRLLGGLALLLLLAALGIVLTGPGGDDPTCMRTADGTVLKVSGNAMVIGGGGTVVSCEAPPDLLTDVSVATPTARRP